MTSKKLMVLPGGCAPMARERTASLRALVRECESELPPVLTDEACERILDRIEFEIRALRPLRSVVLETLTLGWLS